MLRLFPLPQHAVSLTPVHPASHAVPSLCFLTAEVDVTGRKAVVIFVPFKLLKVVHKIQSRLVRELEKKFSGKHVVLIGQRRIMRKPSAGQRQPKQKRPRRHDPSPSRMRELARTTFSRSCPSCASV